MPPITRRGLLQGAGALAVTALAADPADAGLRRPPPGWVRGKLTGAEAAVEALKAEGCEVVFGIPGAQENELWDVFKSRRLPYLLATHEFSAACSADGYARAAGKPGVLCVVPGPGLTNSLTGIGEALLDSVPMVVLVGDVARGDKYRPFQVHSLDGAALLRPVTKAVFEAAHVTEIPGAVRQAFALAVAGEPGPVGVIVPYNLLLEAARFDQPPLAPAGVPFDPCAFRQALALLADRRLRVGIYAGLGCMDQGCLLLHAAELLQAPVATSISGKGVVPETHPLAVGWGYGPHGTRTAEKVFGGDPLHPFATGVDCVLAIGVRYSEVSTGFYGNPARKHAVHVDANPHNLGKVLKADVCVHADAGAFLSALLEHADALRRPTDGRLLAQIRKLKEAEAADHCKQRPRPCGIDPMALIVTMRRTLPEDALLYVDVSVSEHLACEAFTALRPRTYFCPADNQSMGWSVPAALGGQCAFPCRAVATLTGDGCFLMSMVEVSTAAREGLPVKFFVLDDQAYHYMQMLQEAAYDRTTATHLARIDYEALARAYGVGFIEITGLHDLEAGVRAAVCQPGPVLVRVKTDYGDRKVRWVEAVRGRFTDELSAAQKARFATRLGARAFHLHPQND